MTAQECLELADFMDARGCPQAAAAWRADADALQTDPDNGELDIEAYEPADAHDVYEPDELFWDLAMNRAADGGRVENFPDWHAVERERQRNARLSAQRWDYAGREYHSAI